MMIKEILRAIRSDWTGSVFRVLSLSTGLIVFFIVLIVWKVAEPDVLMTQHHYLLLSIMLFAIWGVTCISYTMISHNFTGIKKREILIHRLFGASRLKVFLLLQTEHLILLLFAFICSTVILEQLLLIIPQLFSYQMALHNFIASPTLILIAVIGFLTMFLCGGIPNIMVINTPVYYILREIYFKK